MLPILGRFAELPLVQGFKGKCFLSAEYAHLYFPNRLSFKLLFLMHFKMYLRETAIAKVYRRRISGLLAYYLNCDNFLCQNRSHFTLLSICSLLYVNYSFLSKVFKVYLMQQRNTHNTVLKYAVHYKEIKM